MRTLQNHQTAQFVGDIAQRRPGRIELFGAAAHIDNVAVRLRGGVGAGHFGAQPSIVKMGRFAAQKVTKEVHHIFAINKTLHGWVLGRQIGPVRKLHARFSHPIKQWIGWVERFLLGQAFEHRAACL